MRTVLLFALSAMTVAAQTSFPPLPYNVASLWPELPPNWNFKETAGVAVDPANQHVYVFHRGDHPIMEFDSAGRLLRSFGDGLSDRPHAVRIDGQGNVWAVDDGSHTVLVYDKTGRIRKVFGRWRTPSDATSAMPDGSAGGALPGVRDEGVIRFNRPTDVAFAPDGSVFVTDGYGNSRVVKFSAEGKFIREWGERGSAPGEFHTPHSIVVDPKGRVLVADRENYRIQIFDQDGKFQSEWKNIGAPWGLALHNNELFVADGYNNWVVKLSLDGKVLGAFGSMGKAPGQFHYVHQLAVARDGSVYTAEILNWRAQKFSPR